MSNNQPPLLEMATQTLAEFSAQIRYPTIPAEVVDCMKTSVLDSIGCCLFGATLPWTQRVQAMVEEEGSRPVASISGSTRASIRWMKSSRRGSASRSSLYWATKATPSKAITAMP